MVLAALTLANVTVPGPFTLAHVKVRAPGGFGSPSSLADPAKAALNVGTVWSGPALTTGALFTVITTLSLPVSALSFAVS